MTTKTEGRYLFPHSWEGEADRLTALTRAFDPVTRRHLLDRGITDGWRCLEVGGGTGSIARWMSEQVGPKGRVLATDLSLELMQSQGVEGENMELRRLDVLSDPMPDEEFDLVHCRLVLEHLPGRVDALARMAGVLAPGGWLVIEEMTFGTERPGGRRGALMLGGLVTALRLLMQRNGFDGACGGRVPIHFHELGLTDIGAEGTQPVLIGGTPSVEWARPTLGRVRQWVCGDGSDVLPGPLRAQALTPVRRALERRLDGMETLLADPEFVYLAPTFVTTWGRRPPA